MCGITIFATSGSVVLGTGYWKQKSSEAGIAAVRRDPIMRPCTAMGTRGSARATSGMGDAQSG